MSPQVSTSNPLLDLQNLPIKKIAQWGLFAFFVLLLLLWLVSYLSENAYYQRTLPNPQCTYEAWYARFGAPSRNNVTRFKKGSRTYYALSADVEKGWAIPVGVPYYIFDDQGLLVDWVSDIGRDPEFSLRWDMTNPVDITDTTFLRILQAARTFRNRN